MDLKSVIKEQRQELQQIEKKEHLIAREKLHEAQAFLKHPNILVVTGVRRCGKSIFSYLMEKDYKFAYINFDDERLYGLGREDLNKVLEAFYELYGEVEYIILDEVQNVSGWELFANRLRRTKKVILTGSNSNLLSGELATHLTGRYLDIHLLPFSFREFLLLKQFHFSSVYTTEEKAKILNYLNEYLEAGGFPETHKFGKSILVKIYEDILTKDVLFRHQIKKIEPLKKLARYLITNSAEEITYSRLSKIFDIKHVSTVSNWIGYLEDTFLIFRLERFSFKLKQQFIAPKKVYCIDSGMVETMGFKFSENKGKMLETVVAIELQRKKHSTLDMEIYYWKDAWQNEVDFVLKKGKRVSELFQVSYAEDKLGIREREISGLLKASTELKCNVLKIITWNYETVETIGGKKVEFVPLWKWLLG